MKRVPLGGNLLRPNMVLLMVLLSIAWSSQSTAKGPWKFIIKQQRLVTSRVKFQVKDGEPPSLFCPTIGWQTVRGLHAFLSFLLYQITKLPLLRRFSILIFAFVTSNSKGIYRAMRQWNWLICTSFNHQIPKRALGFDLPKKTGLSPLHSSIEICEKKKRILFL